MKWPVWKECKQKQERRTPPHKASAIRAFGAALRGAVKREDGALLVRALEAFEAKEKQKLECGSGDVHKADGLQQFDAVLFLLKLPIYTDGQQAKKSGGEQRTASRAHVLQGEVTSGSSGPVANSITELPVEILHKLWIRSFRILAFATAFARSFTWSLAAFSSSLRIGRPSRRGCTSQPAPAPSPKALPSYPRKTDGPDYRNEPIATKYGDEHLFWVDEPALWRALYKATRVACAISLVKLNGADDSVVDGDCQVWEKPFSNLRNCP
ncbi:hypothetical protein B0H19DRAFT_1260840 [Mycena capillaripes]|nr:hypothetical protein B0H19DRAFT_1260840 [Mycena capillaripes]